MFKLKYQNGLLYVDILLTQGERTVKIDNVIIDTGACHTIILTDFLESLDVELNDEDEIVKAVGYGGTQFSAVRKKVEKIQLGFISQTNENRFWSY